MHCPSALGIAIGSVEIAMLEGNTCRHPNANDIAPALGKIEQVRVEQRADDVLGYDDQSNPRGQSITTKQKKMRYPHGEQRHSPHEAQLNCNAECLIVRILRGQSRDAWA